MSTQETIDDLRRRLNELESQTSDNVPVARPPATPRIPNYFYSTDSFSPKIFNGSFTQWDFFVLGIYTILIMIATKLMIRSY